MPRSPAHPRACRITQLVRLTPARSYGLEVKALMTVVIAVLLLLPSSASAHRKAVAPPGNSGVGQYVEIIPTVGGGRPTGAIHPGGSGSSVLSPSTQRAFSSQGPAGKSAAALANATAPVTSDANGHTTTGQTNAPGHRHAGGAITSASSGPPSSGSSSSASPANSLAKALTGSSGGGGLGLLLPAILVVCAIGGGIVALLRRRRTA